ncbi:hypothetical protein [Mycobacterium avium]|uniref:hypothetical protein n=1 Tax=Mycobacterium avium TaxID=1764 RepID=UPI000A7B6E91
MTNMLPRRGEPPQAWIIALTTKTRKLSYRAAIRLEPDRGASLQRNPVALTVGRELQINVTSNPRRNQRRRRPHTPMLEAMPQVK